MMKKPKTPLIFLLLSLVSVGAYSQTSKETYQYPDLQPATLMNGELTINCISYLIEQQVFGEYKVSLVPQNNTFPFRFEAISITPTSGCDGFTQYSGNVLTGTVLVKGESSIDFPYAYTLTFDKINEQNHYEFVIDSENLYQITEGVKNISGNQGSPIELPYQSITPLSDIELRNAQTHKSLSAWNPLAKEEGFEFTPSEVGTWTVELIDHTSQQIDYFTVTYSSDGTGDIPGAEPEPEQIVLNGSSISANSEGVQVEGSIASITAAGTYTLSGTLTDGQIIVNTKDDTDVILILNGVNLHSSTNAPLFIRKAENTILVLADGTENVLTDSNTYVFADPDDDEPDATLFSKSDITISGKGSLTVNANYNDGIKSKDGLTITNGTIVVNSVDDGIIGKDYLIIKDSNITVDAAGDGFKSTNDDSDLGYISIEGGNLNLTSGADAIQAETNVTILAGTFVLNSGGGSDVSISEDDSAKGIKATTAITIENGTFSINSADDAIHANESITIHDGEFAISSGDDGIHADSVIEINQGDFRISKSYEGIESSTITINGGTFDIISTDDGINIASGVDGSSQGQFRPFRPRDDAFSTQEPPNFPANGPDFTQEPPDFPENDPQSAQERPDFPANDPSLTMPEQANASTNNYLYINGGYIVVDATGDGLDANGSIVMTDGVVIVNGPTANNNGALDYDGTFTISGGYLVAAGSSRMAQVPGNSSSQYSVLITFNSAIPAGTLFHIEDSEGEDIVTFAPTKNSQSIAFSSAKLANGATYHVYSGGSSTGAVTDGLYEGGTYTPGTQYTSFTISNMVTTVRN